MKKTITTISIMAFLFLILLPISRQVNASTVNYFGFSQSKGPHPPCPTCVINSVSSDPILSQSKGPHPPCPTCVTNSASSDSYFSQSKGPHPPCPTCVISNHGRTDVAVVRGAENYL